MSYDNLLVNETELNQVPKRNGFLTTLCVLSFCWTILLLLILLLCLCFSGALFDAIRSVVDGTIKTPKINEEQILALNTLLSLGQGTFCAIIAGVMIVYMTSLLGVVKMWKLQKWGFYIYTFINGAGLIYDLYSGSYFMAFISALFILLYGLNLKQLK